MKELPMVSCKADWHWKSVADTRAAVLAAFNDFSDGFSKRDRA
jgi:hypothetical protein